MWKAILAFFAWREVHRTHNWRYFENRVNGQRYVERTTSGGYMPRPAQWFDGSPL